MELGASKKKKFNFVCLGIREEHLHIFTPLSE
jgi:hypothetical protein